MSVILARLQQLGSRTTHAELRYQLAKRDCLNLSDDELANQVRLLELRGDVEVTALYKASSKSERASGPNRPRPPVPARASQVKP